MDIISIQINEGRVQFIPSDGVTPAIGLQACEAVADAFRELLVQAEVEQRIAAAQEAKDDERPVPDLPTA